MARTILETPRLALREMNWGDLDFVATMLADPLVMRYFPKCCSRSEAEEWLTRQINRYAGDGHGLWLVSNRETGEPVGQVGLTKQFVDDRHEPEIGYLIHQPFWRLGFATEAAAAVSEYAFAQLQLEYVISLIRPVNVPSQRVALRIGMKPDRLTSFRGYEHLIYVRRR